LAKVIENQGEILHEVKAIKSNFVRIENRLKDIEEKLENNFDFKNEKTFQEVIILSLNLFFINIKIS
jgi:tetrahydromethanopterin S-methyltransferase subunit G